MENNLDNVTAFFQSLDKNCHRVIKHSYLKGETITTYVEKRMQLCILINGEADLIRYDFNGNKTIIGHFIKNNIFGEVLYPANTNNELFVLAKTNCEVLFFSYNDIWNKCKSNCTFHKDFSEQINKLIVAKAIDLNTRIELLTKKNIRDKLLSYFEIMSRKRLSKSFSIPFSYTDLADYLSIDRSAMTRELSRLIDEGFIKKKGKVITLLYE